MTTRTQGLFFTGALVAFAALTATTNAAAQTTGFALDRYDPTPTDLFFASEHPWYSGSATFALRAGLIADYARNPLVARGSDGSTRTLVANMLVLHPQLGIALFNRVGINLSLPVGVLQDGATANTNSGTLGATGTVGVGDLRIGARVRIFNEADRDAVSLHASVYGFVPVADRASNLSDGALRVRAALTLAGHVKPLRWSVGGGVHVRPDFNTGTSSQVGTEVIANAAVGFTAANERLTIGPEAWVSTNVSQPSSSRPWNGEVILGAHYLIADAVLLGAGVGAGLTQGPGTPEIRGLFQVAYAPSAAEAPAPIDTDGDGVFDPDDACPTEPMGDHPDPARNGCPLDDRDRDGVRDADDQCPDVAQGDHPDPARRGCPEGDRDHDGVLDSADRCPDEPQGDHPNPERAGCPDGDSDSDGVLDHADQCPSEPMGLLPDPARAGCPAPDRDHDMVPDATDHCPDEPGAPSPDPVRNGCPGLVRVEQGNIRILEQVFFDTDRDTIKPRSFRVLTAVADVLRATPTIRRVSIEGHTDNAGSEAHNVDLSRRRANAVMTWLVAHGIEAERLEAQGYGPTRPIDTNATPAGRARNRRSEFHILDPH